MFMRVSTRSPVGTELIIISASEHSASDEVTESESVIQSSLPSENEASLSVNTDNIQVGADDYNCLSSAIMAC